MPAVQSFAAWQACPKAGIVTDIRDAKRLVERSVATPGVGKNSQSTLATGEISGEGVEKRARGERWKCSPLALETDAARSRLPAVCAALKLDPTPSGCK